MALESVGMFGLAVDWRRRGIFNIYSYTILYSGDALIFSICNQSYRLKTFNLLGPLI